MMKLNRYLVTSVLFTLSLSTYSKAIPGQYVVKIHKAAFSQQNARGRQLAPPSPIYFLKQLLKSQGVQSIKRLHSHLKERASLTEVLQVSVKKDLNKEDLKSIEEQAGVEWIEPVYELSIYKTPHNHNIPNDENWFDMWSLKNYGQEAGKKSAEGVVGADIKLMDSWKVTKGSKDIVVAVIDTGIDYTHPDLKSNIWVNMAEKNGDEGIDDDGNGYTDDVFGWNFQKSGQYFQRPGHPDPMDDHMHGTHVAGTIGASSGNSLGVVGINQHVSLMALKFLGANGSGSTVGAERAIMYAADMGADIINASWGGGPHSRLLKEAIEYAESKGVSFIAAAGNDGTNNDYGPHFPSNYDIPSLISVAATNNMDRMAWFSNFGPRTVHIAAPGVDILSTIPSSNSKRGEYYFASGTSMATPHVVGVAALTLAANPDLRKKPLELKKRLLKSSDYLPHLTGQVECSGRLNAHSAVSGIEREDQQGEWVEKAISIVTAKYPKERIKRKWTIEFPDALAYRVHFKKASFDRPYDNAGVFDESYRHVMEVPTTNNGTWTPVIWGKRVHVNMSTALVRDEDGNGNVIKEAYANNESEGLEIDKVEVLTKIN